MVIFSCMEHGGFPPGPENGMDVKPVSGKPGGDNAGFALRTYAQAARRKQDQMAEAMSGFMAQVL